MANVLASERLGIIVTQVGSVGGTWYHPKKILVSPKTDDYWYIRTDDAQNDRRVYADGTGSGAYGNPDPNALLAASLTPWSLIARWSLWGYKDDVLVPVGETEWVYIGNQDVTVHVGRSPDPTPRTPGV
jgi:hypothetical protein